MCDYVHLNPARAKLLTPEQRLAEYRWSSWPQYLQKPGQRCPWLRVDRVLGEYRIAKDNAAGRRQLELAMEQRKEWERARECSDWKELRRSWCWGTGTFREELLEKIAEKQSPAHHGGELREADEQKAQRLVREMLEQAGWTDGQWDQHSKGHHIKTRMAARLRRETTMTWQWIAKRLGMGHSAHGRQCGQNQAKRE